MSTYLNLICRSVKAMFEFERHIYKSLVHLQDIEFTKNRERTLKMDILHPKISTKLMPVLVWIHGGAWRSGDKKEGLKHLVSFARQGFFCASIEYRLSHEAIFPAQIQDCKCAIRFLRAHAQKFHIDPHRIGVWGVSAGGHLAALLGTTEDIQEFEGSGGWQNYSSCVQAVCDWFGPTDFLRINDFLRNIDFTPANSPEAALIGGLIEENQDTAAKANPITYVSKEVPPFLIVHGDKDLLVPLNQSQLLFNALQKVEAEVTFEIIKGGKHGDKKKFGSRALSKKMENFFKKHLI
ncbi:alpha/beta hydrolase [Gloeocapsopsis crepidinum LEGE 06123]|uniref:Alpha/beta hydrolase n=1 Tax=Gloeocapsopsis crepidinum LEGE 06123 TaxID=588587 RepID=A0ABR9UR21_9CHRO|nr:alpha/beta hydrolase [Gloeocapsopsis crepidinum]MBE9190505.1 alpha/beta hydrolase [Gloeocapsopsis crepidinum LEGE 06123]